MAGNKTKKVFILRNNDLGDVLVATPLIKGLRKAFPKASISMGIGDWARPLLENNPYLDEIISIIRKAISKYESVITLSQALC